MKSSKYNLIFDYKGKQLAFNGMTCAFAKVNSDFLKILKKLESGQLDISKCSEKELELIKNMKKGGFIVDDCFDELEFLRFKNYKGRFNTNRLGLTIAPTYSCNFACPYCYENTKNTFMSHDVMDAICKEVEKAAKNKKRIHITWYGGEPLLAKSIIWELSDKFITYAEKFGADYSAGIVTNGYLLDNETIENFLKHKIKSTQITIDGPSDIHNSRRKLKNSSEPTFDTILSNAKKTLDAGIHLSIRINVDKTNENRVTELLDVLLDYGLKDAKVYLGHVNVATKYCQSIENDCLTTKDYAIKSIDFEKELIKKGFNVGKYPLYPSAKGNHCGADSLTSKVVAPDGSLYKCWHDISEPNLSIGNIKNLSNLNEQNVMNQVKYMLFDPFKIEECKNCNILPLCMGGCPNVYNIPSCRDYKYSLVENLKHTYDLLEYSTDRRSCKI